ncbi:MAG: cytochrome P450 [Nostoc sp. CmiVER01]|uniref:cytochrome P450 n=1 Tax=Nostoc sp. CmiVER01 TaxID=3075384 RepID=UPI002AD43345|nr:cytochrome P450 [Nostoc sp. CmiVER01]MDZ8125671.1 cytochrome P450 [Nostoc sp. CmiVER01]
MKLPQTSNIPGWLLRMQFAADPLGCMDNFYKRYGEIFAIVSDSTPIVYVSNPQGMKQIFTNTTEIIASGELNQDVAPLVGNNGLLLLDGLRHRHRRKLLMPAFHGNRIRTYGERICELTEKVMEQLPVGKSFLAYPTMQKITLEVILDTLFGLREGERYEKLRQVLSTLMKYARSSFVGLSLSFPFLQRDLGRWSPWGYFLYLWQQFDELLYAEISDRRQQPNSSGIDVLSELIFARNETGELMTNEEIRDLFPSLLFGGRDASATAITWSLYWIHRLPVIRERLLEEIASLGNSKDPMKIFELPYLNAVCNEVLRIYPTQVVTFPRIIESPIEIMGYKLNPGTIIIGCIYLTHQNQDLYPQPQEFLPERFLERQYSPYEFLPFGGGARRCPGEALALFEMKLVLATILSRYQLALSNNKPERPQAQGANFPPASGLKMMRLETIQHQEHLSILSK